MNDQQGEAYARTDMAQRREHQLKRDDGFVSPKDAKTDEDAM